MFNSKLKAELQQCQEQLLAQQGFFDAVHGSVATITFTPDGTVLAANDLFLNVVGFSAPEVVGHHHRMFCDPQRHFNLHSPPSFCLLIYINTTFIRK